MPEPTWRLWADAFVLTQLVEAPLYAWLLHRACLGAPRRRLLWAFGASAWTHPIVWFVFPPAVFGVRALFTLGDGDDPTGYAWMFITAEAFAVLGEAAYWRALSPQPPQPPQLSVSARPLPWRDALRWSLLANGASVLTGALTRWLWGWP